MPPIDYFSWEPFPIEWISNIQEKKDDFNSSLSFSQKRDKGNKFSGHYSLERSFDSGQLSPEKPNRQKNAKNSKKVILNIKTKKSVRPQTAASSEIMLLGRKSKFSYENNETFPESTKSMGEKNIFAEPVEN